MNIENLSPECTFQDLENFIDFKKNVEFHLNEINKIGKFAVCTFLYKTLQKNNNFIEINNYNYNPIINLFDKNDKQIKEDITNKIKFFLKQDDFNLFLDKEDEMDEHINIENFYFFISKFLGEEQLNIWLTNWEKAKINASLISTDKDNLKKI